MTLRNCALLALAVVAVGCDSEAPTRPLPAPNISAPSGLSPVSGEQLLTLRPTLRVTNSTSDQQGTKTYEFQVADNSNFTITPNAGNSDFVVAVTKTGVPEGSSGQTEYTLETDLQPGTNYFWRARANQVTASGSSPGAWSSAAQFRSRPGDPVINAPTLEAPGFDATVVALRPVLSVNNAPTNQAGAKAYEFALSENPEFDLSRGYGFVRGGIAEGTNGRTSLAVHENLPGGKLLFWRARMVLATTDLTEIHGVFPGPWSATFQFRSQLPDPIIGRPRNVSPADDFQLETARPTLTVENAVIDQAGVVVYQFEIGEGPNVISGGGKGVVGEVPVNPSGTTSFTLPVDLVPGRTYTWHARATIVTPKRPQPYVGQYSDVTRVKSKNDGFFQGQRIVDPLVGKTVGKQRGGHFKPEGGWQSDSLFDGIDYDIPTCRACILEWDITDVGRAEGRLIEKDLKFLSMGDASTYCCFTAFRNHPWKMHLEQRSDGNGTGMKLIWRNGDSGGGNPGDHDLKVDPAVDWRSDETFHFRLEWDPGGFLVAVDGKVWFRGSFGGRAFQPPNHRISLGTYPRGETIGPGATWLNVKLEPK